MRDIHLRGAAKTKGVHRGRKSPVPVEIVRTMRGKGQEAGRDRRSFELVLLERMEGVDA